MQDSRDVVRRLGLGASASRKVSRMNGRPGAHENVIALGFHVHVLRPAVDKSPARGLGTVDPQGLTSLSDLPGAYPGAQTTARFWRGTGSGDVGWEPSGHGGGRRFPAGSQPPPNGSRELLLGGLRLA